MNCVEALDLVIAALEGAVPAALRPDFDAHVAACNNCRNYLDQLTITMSALAHLPREREPNPRRSLLLERFRATTRRPR